MYLIKQDTDILFGHGTMQFCYASDTPRFSFNKRFKVGTINKAKLSTKKTLDKHYFFWM